MMSAPAPACGGTACPGGGGGATGGDAPWAGDAPCPLRISRVCDGVSSAVADSQQQLQVRGAATGGDTEEEQQEPGRRRRRRRRDRSGCARHGHPPTGGRSRPHPLMTTVRADPRRRWNGGGSALVSVIFSVHLRVRGNGKSRSSAMRRRCRSVALWLNPLCGRRSSGSEHHRHRAQSSGGRRRAVTGLRWF